MWPLILRLVRWIKLWLQGDWAGKSTQLQLIPRLLEVHGGLSRLVARIFETSSEICVNSFPSSCNVLVSLVGPLQIIFVKGKGNASVSEMERAARISKPLIYRTHGKQIWESGRKNEAQFFWWTKTADVHCPWDCVIPVSWFWRFDFGLGC